MPLAPCRRYLTDFINRRFPKGSQDEQYTIGEVFGPFAAACPGRLVSLSASIDCSALATFSPWSMETRNATSEAGWSQVISSTDRGALVSIAAWLMMIAGLMSLGMRMCIRIPWRKLLGKDDYMTIIATVRFTTTC